MNKTILGTGILFGLLAVLIGAFGAHGLQGRIPDSAMQAYETGVAYQMYHALLLLLLGSLNRIMETHKKGVYYLLVSGILCFSFSLYLLAIGSLVSFPLPAIGLITPLGGLLLLSGWLLMGYRLLRT